MSPDSPGPGGAPRRPGAGTGGFPVITSAGKSPHPETSIFLQGRGGGMSVVLPGAGQGEPSVLWRIHIFFGSLGYWLVYWVSGWWTFLLAIHPPKSMLLLFYSHWIFRPVLVLLTDNLGLDG